MEYKSRILIVDDEPEMLSACSKILKALGHQPIPVQSGDLAIQVLEEEELDLILCDLLMPDTDGMQVLQAVQKYIPHIPVIIFTAYGTIDRAVSVMKEGAFDFIEKPFEAEHLKVILEKGLHQRNLIRERDNLLSQLKDKYNFDNIIGKSPVMQKIFNMVESVTLSDSNILISGESGTGKELIARSIHTRSNRKMKPFVPVNCSAFPENLFEAELFGYEKGAFTGATKTKIGLLEYGHTGTVFLDEVCELPTTLQTKLLRVLQNQQLRHIGGNELIQINIRLLSATNRELQNALQEGKIREDFYYRLNVINIHLPPLRERKEDIRLLAEYFLQKILKSSPKEIDGFNDEVMNQFEKYNWPGNVRELENIVERAVTLAKGKSISLAEIPFALQSVDSQELSFANLSLSEAKQKAIDDIEKKYLVSLLRKYKGHVTKIADEAGMTRRNIHRLLNRHNIDPNTWR
jgi:two-component system NtrC family response regulator/two-component system response regulator AtoC